MDLQEFTRKNLILVVSGPSGAGKSTVLKKVLEDPQAGPGLEFSVSATTRRPRPGEREGKEYHFISEAEFKRLREEGRFLEWARVHSSFYGTPESNVAEAFGRGRDLVLEIDVKGALQVKEKAAGAVFIFIAVPAEELERRLRARPSNLEGAELEKDLQLRLKDAHEEMVMIPEYDYLLINEKLDECVKSVISIIGAERTRIIRKAAG